MQIQTSAPLPPYDFLLDDDKNESSEKNDNSEHMYALEVDRLLEDIEANKIDSKNDWDFVNER